MIFFICVKMSIKMSYIINHKNTEDLTIEEFFELTFIINLSITNNTKNWTKDVLSSTEKNKKCNNLKRKKVFTIQKWTKIPKIV